MYDPSAFTVAVLAGVALVAFLAFGIVRSASAERKRWPHARTAWRATRFERICAWIMSFGFIAMALPFLVLAEFAWTRVGGDLTSSDGFGAIIVGALALAFPSIGVLGLYRLFKGKWVAFP